MASIKMDSKTVIKACDKWIEKMGGIIGDINRIQKLAEYSPSGTIYITHEDFALIGKYLPKPTIYKG